MANAVATCVSSRLYLRASKVRSIIASIRHLSNRNTSIINGKGSSVELNDTNENSFYPMKKLVEQYLEKTSPIFDYGSIYIKYHNAKKAVAGVKPPRRVVWKEQDCSQQFPGSPESANLDLLNYLEQRDMWQRQQTLHIPDFCVGSIVAVTRADQFSPLGWTRFVGLCIHKNFSTNTKGANFILRNVIQSEPLEIQYPLYSPLIQKIEVLRHQRWENEKPFIGLRFLRDFPPEYSTVNMKMVAEPYTEEPSVRLWTQDDKENIVKWFDAIYESRRRR